MANGDRPVPNPQLSSAQIGTSQAVYLGHRLLDESSAGNCGRQIPLWRAAQAGDVDRRRFVGDEQAGPSTFIREHGGTNRFRDWLSKRPHRRESSQPACVSFGD